MKLGIALLVGIAIGGCTASTGQNAVIAGSYEADQLACVDKAASRVEADACRCVVKARYGRPCADAGAPAEGGIK